MTGDRMLYQVGLRGRRMSGIPGVQPDASGSGSIEGAPAIGAGGEHGRC